MWIYASGIWLHESGILGASPDGLVVTPARNLPLYFQTEAAQLAKPDIIEVKCPFSARDMTIKCATAAVKDFFIGKGPTCMSFQSN